MLTPVGIDQWPSFWPSLGYAIDIQPDLSHSVLSLARSWLEDCTSLNGKHAICGRSENTPLLPTRLIDIGPDSNTNARLYLPQPGEKGHWVALSHCWGNVISLQTTTSNLDDFQKGLPTFPQTFADAIYVARTLGQRYLWIDSLCIIQDSARDWATESSRMDRIYSQALFTIVADAAENCTSGFLQPPARNVKKTTVIHCDVGNGTKGDEKLTFAVHVRERGKLAYQLPSHDFHPGRSPYDELRSPSTQRISSKLSTRAWAFQERILSARTLHFGPTEIAWECRALCACECSATNERTGLVKSLLKDSHALQPSFSESAPSKDKHDLKRVDNAWQRDIVEEYTQLNLTKKLDRLPALAGLAARTLSFRPGDQYMAGLWRNTLADGLSWYTNPGHPSARLPWSMGDASLLGSSPPSWSWASVSGNIKYARVADVPVGSPLIRILRVHYQPNAKYPMGSGPRAPASLLVWGYLVPIANIWYQRYVFELDDDNWGAEWTRRCYRIQWPSGVQFPHNSIAMMDVHKNLPPFDDEIRLDRLDEEEPVPESFMLLTALTQGQVFGLILRRRGTSCGVPTYERSGFVNGTDALKDYMHWGSEGQSASGTVREPDWLHDKQEAISPLLGGIGKRMMKIY